MVGREASTKPSPLSTHLVCERKCWVLLGCVDIDHTEFVPRAQVVGEAYERGGAGLGDAVVDHHQALQIKSLVVQDSTTITTTATTAAPSSLALASPFATPRVVVVTVIVVVVSIVVIAATTTTNAAAAAATTAFLAQKCSTHL